MRRRADRAWAWLHRATKGIRTWLILLAVFAGLGFWYAVDGFHDRRESRALDEGGQWEVVHDIQVRVDQYWGRPASQEVDRVRVLLGDDGWVELTNVNTAEDHYLDEELRRGWQTPSSATGYEAPLEIRVKRDSAGAVLGAMARADHDYWYDGNVLPETALAIGIGGVVLGSISLRLNILRLDRRARREGPAA